MICGAFFILYPGQLKDHFDILLLPIIGAIIILVQVHYPGVKPITLVIVAHFTTPLHQLRTFIFICCIIFELYLSYQLCCYYCKIIRTICYVIFMYNFSWLSMSFLIFRLQSKMLVM